MADVIRETWSTTLSVRDLAGWFKSVAEARYNSLGFMTKKLYNKAYKVNGVEFFTPQPANDPFAVLDDVPAFAAGATMPRGGSGRNNEEPVTVHIYLAEFGDHRTVQFVLPLLSRAERWKGNGHSQKAAEVVLRHFRDQLVGRDRGAVKLG